MSEYDEFSELLGAYALDAVDDDERELIERHLVDCPRCRAEVAEHREVAAFLSQSGASAPDGVWDRIASELSPPAPPMRMTISPAASEDEPDDTVTPLSDAPSVRRGASSNRSRTLLALLAAAACIVAVLGFVAVGQSNRLNKLESAIAQDDMDSLVKQTKENSEVSVQLTGEAGDASAVVGKDGRGFLLMDEAPAPPEGDLYQLWGKVDGTVISLGTFGSGEDLVVPFSVDPERLDDIELFAVTQEHAPGVPSSENEAIMAGTV